jgi:DNA-binding transcriptional ArsR family regulator
MALWSHENIARRLRREFLQLGLRDSLIKSENFSEKLWIYLDICLNIYSLDLLFKALRDPTRRRVLEMLKERDLTAGQIAEAFSMTAPSISYHLDLLKHAQLVSSRKKGQFVTYSLETTVLDDSLGWILDLIKKGKRK